MAKKIKYSGLKSLTPRVLHRRVAYLMKVNILAHKLFKNEKETNRWILTPTSMFFGSSPFEVIMRGEGIHVVQFLKERLGQKSGKAL